VTSWAHNPGWVTVRGICRALTLSRIYYYRDYISLARRRGFASRAGGRKKRNTYPPTHLPIIHACIREEKKNVNDVIFLAAGLRFIYVHACTRQWGNTRRYIGRMLKGISYIYIYIIIMREHLLKYRVIGIVISHPYIYIWRLIPFVVVGPCPHTHTPII